MIRGEAGSGKTTILAHRGRFINDRNPGSMLYITYNKALETYLKQLIEEQRLSNVKVRTFHSWVWHFAQACGIEESPKFANQEQKHYFLNEARNTAEQKWGDHPLLSQSDVFWAEVVSSASARNLITSSKKVIGLLKTLDDSFGNPEDSQKIIKDVLQTYQRRLWENNLYDSEDPASVVFVVKDFFGEKFPPKIKVDHLFIDEVQDFDASWLRALAPASRKSITMAGDLAQRIYRRDFTWKSVGIELPGSRSHKLEGSYRTTRQIMNVALYLATNPDLKTNVDYVPPTLPENPASMVMRIVHPSAQKARERAIRHILQMQKRYPAQDIVLASYARNAAETLAHELVAAGVRCVYAMREDVCERTDAIISTTYHQLKGLEFSNVVLFDLEDETIPESGLKITGLQTPEEQEHYLRRLVFMAMTRASSTLTLVGGEPFCRFFDEVPNEYFCDL